MKRFENRLNRENIKFRTQNPVWDNKQEDALNVFEMITVMNHLNKEADFFFEEWRKYLHIQTIVYKYKFYLDEQKTKGDVDNVKLEHQMELMDKIITEIDEVFADETND